MDLTVREAAELLAVPEDTLYRWIRSGSLPAQKKRHQYWINRVELQEWAAVHGRRVLPELFTPRGSAGPGLRAALERGGIHAGVSGTRRDEVLLAVSRLPGIPEGVDRDLLHQLLVAREVLTSTGIGGGIALPHPRDPLVLRVAEPHVLLCFLANAVDFGALDRQPVRVLFLLLSPSVHAHLQMLAKLAYVLHDEELRGLLGRQERPEAILERVGVLESATP